jgi:type III secretion protein S
MHSELIAAKVNAALLTVLVVSGPVLAAAVALGLVVGILQAVTQIQDQTLPLAVKLIAILLVLIVFGPIMAGQVVDQASLVLSEFPTLTR